MPKPAGATARNVPTSTASPTATVDRHRVARLRGCRCVDFSASEFHEERQDSRYVAQVSKRLINPCRNASGSGLVCAMHKFIDVHCALHYMQPQSGSGSPGGFTQP